MRQIYLDFNASAPVSGEVRNAMEPYWDGYVGNPSSQHWAGTPFKDALNLARAKVAGMLGCSTDEVIFTSGGSESNNHSIKGIFFAQQSKGRHIIISSIEHPSVINPCEYLKRFGAEVTCVPVDSTGRIDPYDVKDAIRKDTVLISIMHSNNEVGTVQPIAEISNIARSYGATFHSDAAQSIGKIPTKVNELGVDLLSIAGHKFYAPKGIGALYIRRGTSIDPLIHGAGHESGRRAGTENIPLCVGLGVASEEAENLIVGPSSEKIKVLRDELWSLLKDRFSDKIVRNGHPVFSLPNTLNVCFVGQSGNQILAKMPSVAASTGSACHSGHDTLSPVLKAMGVPSDVGLGAIRFSLGRTTTDEEIRELVTLLARVVN